MKGVNKFEESLPCSSTLPSVPGSSLPMSQSWDLDSARCEEANPFPSASHPSIATSPPPDQNVCSVKAYFLRFFLDLMDGN